MIKDVISQEYGRLESFLIIKNEKLVLEEYFYNYSRKDLHNIFSCTKSIVSLASGIALKKVENLKVKNPIFDIFPQFNTYKNEENQECATI